MEIISPTDLKFIEQMVDCQVAMALETENLKLNHEIVTKGMTEVINNSTRGKYYLALDKSNNLMGMLFTLSEWSDWRCAEVLWIHSVYIKPDYRGKKIYKDMYLHLQQIVETNDQFAGLRLYVDKTNNKAKAVYEKLGMSDEHYSLYEWLKD